MWTGLCSTVTTLSGQVHLLEVQCKTISTTLMTSVSDDLQLGIFLIRHWDCQQIKFWDTSFWTLPRKNRRYWSGKWLGLTNANISGYCRFLGNWPVSPKVLDYMKHGAGAPGTHCPFLYSKRYEIPDCSTTACKHFVHLCMFEFRVGLCNSDTMMLAIGSYCQVLRSSFVKSGGTGSLPDRNWRMTRSGLLQLIKIWVSNDIWTKHFARF